MNKILQNLSKIPLNATCPKSNFSTSSQLSAGKLWRMSVGLPKLQTAKGHLIDTPDYSFLGEKDVE